MSSESTQFYHEVHNVIRRYKAEGDELTTFEILGALEAVKADILDSLKKYHIENPEEGE